MIGLTRNGKSKEESGIRSGESNGAVNELHCRCLRNWDRQQFIKEDFRAVRNYPDEDTQNMIIITIMCMMFLR